MGKTKNRISIYNKTVTMKYALLICVTLFFACNANVKEQKVNEQQVESSVSSIQLLKLDGGAVDWSVYKGKTVFINFWATWCGPCLEEMPSIQAAMEQLKDEDIVFLFASEETTEQIEKFKAVHPFRFNYLRIDNMLALNIMGLPTTMIYDKTGKKVFSEMGFRNWSSKENIDLLLDINKTK